MNRHQRVRQALESLVSPSDRYHPESPKEPIKPREPLPTISKWEKIMGDASCRSLSEIVDESLCKAGIDPESVPENLREAFDRTSIEVDRDSYDDSPSIRVDWEERSPNPIYEVQKKYYDEALVLYEKECQEYVEKIEKWVQNRNAHHAKLEEQKELAELARLQAKYGKK